jgi:hypothetical protein
MTTPKKPNGFIKPRNTQSERVMQLRSLLTQGKTIKELVEMGYPLAEATTAKIALNKKADRVRCDTGYQPKDLIRCQGCGNLASEKTFECGLCMGCVVRERTNQERKGRFRV